MSKGDTGFRIKRIRILSSFLVILSIVGRGLSRLAAFVANVMKSLPGLTENRAESEGCFSRFSVKK